MLRPGFPLPEIVLDEDRADSNIEWLSGKVGEDLATGSHMEVLSTAAFRAHRALQARAPGKLILENGVGWRPGSTTEPPIDFDCA
jgi:hypothetical protein